LWFLGTLRFKYADVENAVKRIKLKFAPGVETEFVDRDRALGQIAEWAEKSTRFPVVVFGPEGCGKSALLRQVAEALGEFGFDVVYVDAAHRDFVAYTDVAEVARRLLDAASDVSGLAQLKLAYLAVDLAKELIGRWGKKKVAVLVDEVFQEVGLDKAGVYVKSLLNLIEYPPRSYEKIVAIAVISEGVTREEIGRHLWAELRPMWNMPGEGFRQLYEKLPGPKPPFEEAWRWVGGNPRMLGRQNGWDVEEVVLRLMREKELTAEFVRRWGRWLEAAVEDPETLWTGDAPEKLARELEARNLIVYNMYDRRPSFWIDQPPPERDPELSIGKNATWQTPIHREAVRKALERV
jgi:energy-coupling factor transporter ATP-binding protein EcfA2